MVAPYRRVVTGNRVCVYPSLQILSLKEYQWPEQVSLTRCKDMVQALGCRMATNAETMDVFVQVLLMFLLKAFHSNGEWIILIAAFGRLGKGFSNTLNDSKLDKVVFKIVMSLADTDNTTRTFSKIHWTFLVG